MSLIANLSLINNLGYQLSISKIQDEVLFSIKNSSNKLIAIGLQIDENFKDEEARFPKYNERFALLFNDYLDYCTSLNNTETVLFLVNSNNIWFMPINQVNPIGLIQNSIDSLINFIKDQERRASESF
jgi:hypothetical protein